MDIYIASWPVVIRPSSTLPSGLFSSYWNPKTRGWSPISQNPMTLYKWSRPSRTRILNRTRKTQKTGRARSLRWHGDASNFLEAAPSKPLSKVDAGTIVHSVSFSAHRAFLTCHRVLSGHFRFSVTATATATSSFFLLDFFFPSCLSYQRASDIDIIGTGSPSASGNMLFLGCRCHFLYLFLSHLTRQCCHLCVYGQSGVHIFIAVIPRFNIFCLFLDFFRTVLCCSWSSG